MDNTSNISDNALEITKALLIATATAPTVDEDLLARFSIGWVTEAEHYSVIEAMTESRAIRSRVLEMFDGARAMQAGVQDRERVLAGQPALVTAINGALRSAFQLFSGWQVACESAWGPTSGPTSGQAGIGEVLKGFGRLLADAPLRPATSRSGRHQVTVTIQPTEVRASLEVLAEEGALRVEGRIMDPIEEPKDLSLFIIEPGGGWAWIGSAVTRGDEWKLTAHNVLEMLELTADELDPQWFALTEGRLVPRRNLITIAIDEQLREPGLGDQLRLKLVDQPSVSNGQFLLKMELPQAVRDRFKDAMITAAFELGPVRYPIGAWSIAGFGAENTLELSAAVPREMGEGVIDYLPGVSFSLVRA